MRVIERPVDLIFLDIQMPGMDGFETAQHLKMTLRTKDIPIIFLTAVFKTEEFIQRGYAVGAIDYLTKPLNDNQLLNRIALYRSLHEREKSLKQALQEVARSSEERLSSLIKTVDGIVWEADAKSLTFTFVSEQAARLLVKMMRGFMNIFIMKIHRLRRKPIYRPCLIQMIRIFLTV